MSKEKLIEGRIDFENMESVREFQKYASGRFLENVGKIKLDGETRVIPVDKLDLNAGGIITITAKHASSSKDIEDLRRMLNKGAFKKARYAENLPSGTALGYSCQFPGGMRGEDYYSPTVKCSPGTSGQIMETKYNTLRYFRNEFKKEGLDVDMSDGRPPGRGEPDGGPCYVKLNIEGVKGRDLMNKYEEAKKLVGKSGNYAVTIPPGAGARKLPTDDPRIPRFNREFDPLKLLFPLFDIELRMWDEQNGFIGSKGTYDDTKTKDPYWTGGSIVYQVAGDKSAVKHIQKEFRHEAKRLGGRYVK